MINIKYKKAKEKLDKACRDIADEIYIDLKNSSSNFGELKESITAFENKHNDDYNDMITNEILIRLNRLYSDDIDRTKI